LYGQGDTFDPQSSHVLAALILKIHKAKVTRAPSVTLWGTGNALREFMHIDDFVDAAIFLMEHYSAEAPINAGTGQEVSILELAQLISGIVGWEGRFVLDTTKPDGMPRKLLDTTRLNEMGWKPRVTLADGIRATYEWFLDQSPFTQAAS
jgi:GDP-L-fucose synthase